MSYTQECTISTQRRRCRLLTTTLALVVACVTPLAATAATTAADERIQRVTEGYTHPIDEVGSGLSYPPIPWLSSRSADAYDPFDRAWFSAITVHLVGDSDHDGYFGGFDLALDVDANGHLDVYAEIYLQREFEAPRFLHRSRDFTVHDYHRSDEYRIEVTLLDHYPAGHYDLIVDLRDSWTGERLDGVSQVDFQNLGGLPLEIDQDKAVYANDETLVVEYAGGISPLLLAVIATLMALMRRRIMIPSSRTGGNACPTIEPSIDVHWKIPTPTGSSTPRR